MITGNEPAMPAMDTNYREGERILELRYEGLTIRQHFAAMAMTGMLANPKCFEIVTENGQHNEADVIYAVAAVEHADALISELNKTES